jgi:predicted secreted hydrolase
MRRLALSLLLLLGAVVWWRWQDTAPITTRLTVAEALTGDTAGYARAVVPRMFRFPEDHGPHPEFKTEWWYVTGNLRTPEGRPFGYQFTLFRIALAPSDPADTVVVSAWRTRQLYMAHLTLSDIAEGRFYAFERFSRGALGLAGATARPFRAWLANWQLAQVGENVFPWHLSAGTAEMQLNLTLRPLKPVVLQGKQGLDPKGPEPGNASYYYSIPRIATTGTLRIGRQTYTVEGLSWLDREWSTSALGNDQVGWDWFALQLDNGYDLMWYRLRHRDGAESPWSSGALIDPEGRLVHLQAGAVQLEVRDTWISPHSKVTYPALWYLRVPTQELELYVRPRLKDQELNLSLRYWEGAVTVEGIHHGQSVQGSGYVELTGYGEAAWPGKL